MKAFDKRSRQYQLLKSPWKLYLKKYDELEKVHPHYNWHYKDCLTQAQVVMEDISANTVLANLMQSFIQAVEHSYIRELKSLITSKDLVETLMHKTLLTFKHNLKQCLKEQLCHIPMAAFKALIAKLNKLSEQPSLF